MPSRLLSLAAVLALHSCDGSNMIGRRSFVGLGTAVGASGAARAYIESTPCQQQGKQMTARRLPAHGIYMEMQRNLRPG